MSEPLSAWLTKLLATLVVVFVVGGWMYWNIGFVYDPPPNIPSRIGPDGGPAPLTEDEFRRLQDWMRRNRDKL